MFAVQAYRTEFIILKAADSTLNLRVFISSSGVNRVVLEAVEPSSRPFTYNSPALETAQSAIRSLLLRDKADGARG